MVYICLHSEELILLIVNTVMWDVTRIILLIWIRLILSESTGALSFISQEFRGILSCSGLMLCVKKHCALGTYHCITPDLDHDTVGWPGAGAKPLNATASELQTELVTSDGTPSSDSLHEGHWSQTQRRKRHIKRTPRDNVIEYWF